MKKLKKKIPEYMIIYRCESCDMESGFTENEKPKCRYCDEDVKMILISKQKITAEVMAERLKQLTDNMLKNLQSAFEVMTDEDKAAFPADIDPEKEMLLLLDKAKKFRDNIHSTEFKEPEKKTKPRKKKP